MILELLNVLKDYIETQTEKTVVIEPTSPIASGEIAVFYESSEVQDLVEPGTYRLSSSFVITIVENTLENCMSTVNNIISNLTDNLGLDCVVFLRKVEKQSKEETDQFFVVFVYVDVLHFGVL